MRELEGLVVSAYLLARHRGASEIDLPHLSAELTSTLQFERRGDPESNRLIVERMLRITGGNVKKAARLLRVSRTTITTLLRNQLPTS